MSSRHLAAAALLLVALAGCASSDPYAPPTYTASSCSGPSSSYGPVEDGMGGAGRGAVIGAVTGNVVRSVVVGAAMAVGNCLDGYTGP